MKIIFICGSLEPGKDGVGDYVRRLMVELLSMGHEASAIALYDKFIGTNFQGVINIENKLIEVLRISVKTKYINSVSKIEAFIKAKDPDWLSLQFVPFSFHEKGLSLNLAKLLQVAGSGYKWHIMFHEPWIATDGRITIKKKLLGIAQRLLIKRMLKILKPVLINTSNQNYQELLSCEGISTSILPLPSNISVSNLAVEGIENEFVTLGISDQKRNEWCVLGVFGKIRSNVEYLPLVRRAKTEMLKQNKRLAFFSIGKSGTFAQKLMKDIDQEFQGDVLVYEFGERSADEISAYLQLLDYGVSSVSNNYLGKSGAVSAMRLHGLKILVPYSKSESKNAGGYIEAQPVNSDEFSARAISILFLINLQEQESVLGYKIEN